MTDTLGRTPLVVSRIGLGPAALGRPGYIKQREMRANNLGAAEVEIEEEKSFWSGWALREDPENYWGRRSALLWT